MYKVKLEPDLWLAPGFGEPSTTSISHECALFNTWKEASFALTKARTYHDFSDAEIIQGLPAWGL